MYSPLVQEVMEVLPYDENGNMVVVLGVDPPGILVDAIGCFKKALSAVRAEDHKLAMDKARQDQGRPKTGRRR